jgi:hypothetical protein
MLDSGQSVQPTLTGSKRLSKCQPNRTLFGNRCRCMRSGIQVPCGTCSPTSCSFWFALKRPAEGQSAQRVGLKWMQPLAEPCCACYRRRQHSWILRRYLASHPPQFTRPPTYWFKKGCGLQGSPKGNTIAYALYRSC